MHSSPCLITTSTAVTFTTCHQTTFKMIAKIFGLFALFALAYAGHEAPPPKAVTYNVPSVAKVSYPGPTVTKSVETYSAPSIEKTTTITRTITAPLNAPAVKTVSYSAPVAPIVKEVGYAHPHLHPQFHGYGAPIGAFGPQYHNPYFQHAYAAPLIHAFGGPAVSAYGAPVHGHFATTYAAPGLGYALGHAGIGGQVVAAAPVAAKAVVSEGY